MLGVLGDLVQDVVVWPLEPRRRATDTKSEIAMRRGGSAANVAAFAGPRYPTRFLGCVGDDLGGHVLRQELLDRGVDARLHVDASQPTGMIVVLIDPSGERTMFPSRGANTQMPALTAEHLNNVDLLHLTAYSFESGPTASTALDAIHRQHAKGGQVSLDVSSIGLIEHYGIDNFVDLLHTCSPDFISANEDECRLLGLAIDGRPGPTLEHFPHTTLLARRGASATSVLRQNGVIATVPVTPVDQVRDLTGAGDAFNAGFLTAHLQGASPADACTAGHALAARVLRSPGATEDALTAQQGIIAPWPPGS